jgi:hypothetical protein
MGLRSVFVCLMVLTWHAAAAAEAPRVFGMFVGVAEYKYSKGKVPGSDLEDLGGAPNDIAAMRTTLESRLALSRSVTLLNQDATRAAILQTFTRLVDEAAPGDTLLFYYTGHGARLVDLSNQQLSGYNSTLVPYDARDPQDPDSGDILDNELREIIAAATAAGVNVVTIFDSCNSGTATRSPWIEEGTVRLRGAPDLQLAAPRIERTRLNTASAKPASPRQPGYTVHLASAPDGKAAIERFVDGRWRGDFTDALVRSLNELPADASYRELLDSVKMKLRQRLRAETNARVMTDVRGEGALDQGFLGRWSPVRLLEGARAEDGSWQLAAGSIAGVTSGSRFAGYTSPAAARDGKAPPIAAGIVSAVDVASARLTLDPGAKVEGLADKLVWRETARGAGTDRLKVRVSATKRGAGAAIAKQLEGLAFVLASSGNPDIVLDLDSRPGNVRVVRAEDDTDVTVIPVGDDARLRAVLEQIARYHSLLAMVGQGTQLKLDFELSEQACDGSSGPPIVYRDGEAHFLSDQAGRNQFTLVLRNNEDIPLYPNIINLSAGYEVALAATHGDNATEDALEPGRCWNWPATVSGNGRDHLMLVVADRPLPGLQNLTAAAIRGGPHEDPLAALVAAAARGEPATRSAPPGIWSVRAVSYVIEGE